MLFRTSIAISAVRGIENEILENVYILFIHTHFEKPYKGSPDIVIKCKSCNAVCLCEAKTNVQVQVKLYKFVISLNLSYKIQRCIIMYL